MSQLIRNDPFFIDFFIYYVFIEEKSFLIIRGYIYIYKHMSIHLEFLHSPQSGVHRMENSARVVDSL